MEWLQNNWIWLVLGIGFIAFHMFGHGGHGGHGGHSGHGKGGKDRSDDSNAAKQPAAEPGAEHSHGAAPAKTGSPATPSLLGPTSQADGGASPAPRDEKAHNHGS